MNKNKKTNRLIKEKSPYLLQHAYNPVDWYPWGKEAFEKAKKEDKPIFLSIGYSTCHWCHVMAHESFEDKGIAELMNDTFVNIKVDREERPDIDSIYMEVCQMITGSGGWPLTIIMTSEKKPFFAGTYFPKESMYGRIGMKELIIQIKDLWLNKRPEIYSSAEEITKRIQSNSNKVPSAYLSLLTYNKAFEGLKSNYDEQYGGFGNSPKFPMPHNLTFLLRYHKLRGDNKSLKMVEKTLLEMRKGGIYDQIGFGFHRYSTDRQWLVPHFEKMLYDQAQLLIAYTEAYQLTKNEYYKNIAFEIITYVSREMTSKNNSFFSAEDADSDGTEGKFYVWSYEEIKSVLKKDADLFIRIYNVRKEGNFEERGSEKNKNNILYMTKSIKEWSLELNLGVDEIQDLNEKSRIKLFEFRKKRIHPFKDDKILTDWNGLMIAALSIAGFVFDKSEFVNLAKKTADFIIDNLIDKDNRLYHRTKGNEFGILGNLNDYAFFTWGLIELYQTSFNIKYLKTAIKLTDYAILHFWDKKDKGFYFSADNSEELIAKKKEIYDGAMPSGNSIALMDLIYLSKFTGDLKYDKKADELIKSFSGIVNYAPNGYTQFLNSLLNKFADFKEIIIVANSRKDIQSIISLINSYYLPNKILIYKKNGDNDLEKINPLLKEMKMIDNKPTVYLCQNFVCEQPVTDLKKLKELFEN